MWFLYRCHCQANILIYWETCESEGFILYVFLFIFLILLCTCWRDLVWINVSLSQIRRVFVRYDYNLQSAFVEGFLSRIFSSERAEFSLRVFFFLMLFPFPECFINPWVFSVRVMAGVRFFDVGIKAGPPSKEKRICLWVLCVWLDAPPQNIQSAAVYLKGELGLLMWKMLHWMKLCAMACLLK